MPLSPHLLYLELEVCWEGVRMRYIYMVMGCKQADILYLKPASGRLGHSSGAATLCTHKPLSVNLVLA